VLEAAATFEPDIFLIDIGMPLLNGYDVARKLRERYGAAPTLIAITAYSQSADRIAAKIAGFDHHVAKPFKVDALLDLLKTVAPSRG
jgi:CheY-like chemotaxis protein